MVWSFFGVIWVMPQSVVDLFASWLGLFGEQCNIDLWWAVSHCVLCYLWWERNSRCFEGTKMSILEIKSLFVQSLFAWSLFSLLFLALIFLLCLIVVIFDLDVTLSVYASNVPGAFD